MDRYVEISHYKGNSAESSSPFSSHSFLSADGSWDSYNTTEWAKDVLELLDHLGWASEVHAVGYSAGGQVLQQMLLLTPQRFKSIALVSTTAGGTRPFTGAYTLISNLFVSDPHEQLRRLMRINYTKVQYE
jgi:pimeloyl-ACP methyl ester carboxylesterase